MTESENACCVIVGAGHAGSRVALGLRRFGWAGRIVMIGDDPVLPYHRPPLSKDYLKSGGAAVSIQLAALHAYDAARVELQLGVRVAWIDRPSRRVTLDDGAEIEYSRLVLATGSRPVPLPVRGVGLHGVHYLRTVGDADRIRKDALRSRRAVVIGGGYIGLESAAALRAMDLEVTVVERGARVLQRVASAAISEHFSELHARQGNAIRVNTTVRAILGDKAVTGVEMGDGERLPADLVIIGVGVEPNVELASRACLDVCNGIAVDDYATTSDPAIYSAGDCTNFTHPIYRRKVRLESVQNANDQALVAAKSICGNRFIHDSLPWFWSEQFGVKLQIAGLPGDHDELVVRSGRSGGRSFAVFHLRERRLVALEAVNDPKTFVQGKKLIGANVEIDLSKLSDCNVSLSELAA